MIGTLAALSVAVFTSAMATDTTLAVKPGTRLELNQFTGSIEVSAWSRPDVRVVADHDSRVALEFVQSGTTLRVKSVHARGTPTTVDYRLTVPKWMSLELSGINTDVSVQAAEGEVRIETVQGEVTVNGGARSITASSVDGEVVIRGASGRIECSSVNGSVRVEHSSGPIVASTINGEVVLDRVDSGAVDASTINGEVRYEGSIKDGGSYRFTTHNGGIAVAVPERANARVSVVTFSGDFSVEFPVELAGARRGKRLDFTLGNGSAFIELQSFQGGIRLHRPAASGSTSGPSKRKSPGKKEGRR